MWMHQEATRWPATAPLCQPTHSAPLLSKDLLSRTLVRISDIADRYDLCSVDTMASYGQLLGPPSYEDANLFDQVEIRPASPGGDGRGEGAAHAAAGPTMNISVDDPVKRTEQTIIPGRSGCKQY